MNTQPNSANAMSIDEETPSAIVVNVDAYCTVAIKGHSSSDLQVASLPDAGEDPIDMSIGDSIGYVRTSRHLRADGVTQYDVKVRSNESAEDEGGVSRDRTMPHVEIHLPYGVQLLVKSRGRSAVFVGDIDDARLEVVCEPESHVGGENYASYSGIGEAWINCVDQYGLPLAGLRCTDQESIDVTCLELDGKPTVYVARDGDGERSGLVWIRPGLNIRDGVFPVMPRLVTDLSAPEPFVREDRQPAKSTPDAALPLPLVSQLPTSAPPSTRTHQTPLDGMPAIDNGPTESISDPDASIELT
jgi:hypothetical protein